LLSSIVVSLVDIEAQAKVERSQPSTRTYDVDLPTSGSAVVGDEVGTRTRSYMGLKLGLEVSRRHCPTRSGA